MNGTSLPTEVCNHIEDGNEYRGDRICNNAIGAAVATIIVAVILMIIDLLIPCIDTSVSGCNLLHFLFLTCSLIHLLHAYTHTYLQPHITYTYIHFVFMIYPYKYITNKVFVFHNHHLYKLNII